MMLVVQSVHSALARVLRRRVVILALLIGAAYLLSGGAAVAVALLNSTCAEAPSDYFTTLPNGTRMPLPGSLDECQTCHTSAPNFGSFGLAYSQQLTQTLSSPPSGIPSIAHKWDLALAAQDSNGNGYTNGEKLQDPTGAWIYGTSPADIGDGGRLANPGDAAQLPPNPRIIAITGIITSSTYVGTIDVGLTLDTTIGARKAVYEVLDGGLNVVQSYTRQTSSTPYGGYSPSATAFKLIWNTYDMPNGTYTMRVTLYDAKIPDPRTSTQSISDITINNPPRSIRYLATDGTDAGACLDSAQPCRTLDYAIGMANYNDELRLAAGTYTPGAGATPLTIDKRLTLTGGFTRANWSTPDRVANPTILDGQHQRPVLSFTALSTGFEIQNLTIRNGSGANGGGIAIADAVGTIADAIFQGNHASASGGAIYINASGGATIRSSAVLNNSAGAAGGALYAQSVFTATNVLFANNSAPQGATITADHLSGATITYATIAGSGASVEAIQMINQAGPLELENTLISGFGVGVSHAQSNLILRNVLAADDVITPVSGAGPVTGTPLGGPAGYKDSAHGDYHLLFGAPAIDGGAATPNITVDLDGQERPFGSAPDIGAYEFHGPAEVVLFDTAEADVTLPTNAATLVVELSARSLITITVDYATHNGTAIAGVDYQPVSGTLVFAPGQIGHAFAIPIMDTGATVPKLFSVTLSHPTGGANLGAPSTAIVTIKPPVPIGPPRIMITASSPYASRAGSIPAIFTIDRDILVDTPLTVYYTVGGTAEPGVDYAALPGQLTLAAGQYSGAIVVTPLGGSGDKTVVVTLSERQEYVLGRRSATALISDHVSSSVYLPLIRR